MSNSFIIPPVDPNIVPTFLALSLNDDLKHDTFSASSSLTSLSLGDAKRATSIKSRIPLAISDWAKRASLSIPADEKTQTAIELLTYFKNIGLQHLSPDSHPIAILDHSLNELRAENPPQFESGIRRVAHKRLNITSYSLQLRNFVFNEIPIFDIWDAIALIYSVSVEDVFYDQEAELFLYQLRLIFIAMQNTKCWGADYLPSTVAASWRSTPESHLILAFSFTCIGGRRSSLRSEQNLARQNYNQKLFSLVQLSETELLKLDQGRNKAGNCLEYNTWATVCSSPGQYNSLCLNLANEQTMKYCGPCSETAKAAEKIGIIIQDRWKICSLVSPAGREFQSESGYWIKCMDSIQVILPRKRGRRIQKIRRS